MSVGPWWDHSGPWKAKLSMGAIRKRGDNWYMDLRIKGRRVRKCVGPSKQLAELALKDAEVKIARGEFGFATIERPIDAFLDQFIEYSQAHHRLTTTKRYRAVIDHFRAFLKTKPGIVHLSQLSVELIDQYKIYRKESWVNPNGQPINGSDNVSEHTRKGARSHTINFEVGTLRTIFYVAVKWGLLKENPTKGIKKLKVNDAKKPRFLSTDECKRLLNAAPPHLYPIILTFLTTGMRKAELENLEWQDIDFHRRKILIRAKEFWQPKTGEREIPINSKLLSLLKDLKRSNDKTTHSGFVFCEKDGSKLKTKLREQLIRLGKQAGIEDFTKVHTLRHTFASHLVMKGVDLPTVQNLLGHTDIQTTMIYSHLSPDHLVDAVNKLGFDE